MKFHYNQEYSLKAICSKFRLFSLRNSNVRLFDCSEVPAKPVKFTYRNFKVASSLRSPSAKANLFLAISERKLLSCGHPAAYFNV